MEYLTIDDLKHEARKKVPKAFHDYVLSGSWTESTLKDNSNDFKKISFRQRVAVDISNRSTRKSLLGKDYKMPVALAPVGLLGMQKANGEILAAQAAETFGVPLHFLPCQSVQWRKLREIFRCRFGFNSM